MRSVTTMGRPGGSFTNLEDRDIYDTPQASFAGIHQYTLQNVLATPDPVIGNFRNRNIIATYEAVRNMSTGTNGSSTKWDFLDELRYSPIFLDETGIGGSYIILDSTGLFSISKDVTTGLQDCYPEQFHNDLWATICSGAAVSGLEWAFAERPIRHAQWSAEFHGIKTFFSDIDFEAVNYNKLHYHKKGGHYFASRWPWEAADIDATNYTEGSQQYSAKSSIEAISMVSADKNQGFGWFKNRSHNLWNSIETDPCLNAMIYGNTYGGVDWNFPHFFRPLDDDNVDAPIVIDQNDAYFKIRNVRIHKWYTIVFYDTYTGLPIAAQARRSSSKGRLKVKSPDMTLYPDLAFKILRVGQNWKSEPSDTLVISENNLDSSRTERSEIDYVIVYPNPNNGIFVIKSSSGLIKTIQLMTSTGEIVTSLADVNSHEYEYSFSLAHGLYYIWVVTEKGSRMVKIIVSE